MNRHTKLLYSLKLSHNETEVSNLFHKLSEHAAKFKTAIQFILDGKDKMASKLKFSPEC